MARCKVLPDMRRLIATALLLGLPFVVWAQGDRREETQRQIEKTRSDILVLQRDQDRISKSQKDAQLALRKTETVIATLEKQIASLNKDLNSTRDELAHLAQEKNTLETTRDRQQQLIAVQARAAYQSGRQESLRLLLNQQSPEKFSRTLTYYQYLSQARLEQLDGFNRILQQLRDVQTETDRYQAQLEQQSQQLTTQKEQLAVERGKRRQAVTDLTRQLADARQRIDMRRRNQQELEQLLKNIDEEIVRQQQASLPLPTHSGIGAQGQVTYSGVRYSGPFAAQRGKLSWPITGQVRATFGSLRDDDGRTRWDGLLIAAAKGTPVQVVHGGKVVFADWLRGLGQLIIVDHGEGYMTLYGHNQMLMKRVGDTVKAGDYIATLGNSGGQGFPALYFAIRRQGIAIDPAQWCRQQ